MILMILFGFEVDTLEIALREQSDVVDKIFVVESTYTHQGVEFTASHRNSRQYTGNMSSWPRSEGQNIKYHILGPEAPDLAKYKDFCPLLIRRGGED